MNHGLEDEYNFKIDDKEKEKLYYQIEEIENELREYELLKEYLSYDALIDSQIRLQHIKSK